MSYTKLDSSLTASSIWNEPDVVRIVWITMLSMADQDGNVKAAVPGLAHLARKTLAETESALAVLLAPDIHSGRKELEGRRLVPIEGGWHLVTHEFYRENGMSEERRERSREKTRERVKRYRALHSVTPDLICSEKKGSPEGKDEAERIYAIFPNKVAKPFALKAIEKAIKKYGAEHILERTTEYARVRAGNLDFVPHPSTWFNQERFNDDPETWRPKANGQAPVKKVRETRLV